MSILDSLINPLGKAAKSLISGKGAVNLGGQLFGNFLSGRAGQSGYNPWMGGSRASNYPSQGPSGTYGATGWSPNKPAGRATGIQAQGTGQPSGMFMGAPSIGQPPTYTPGPSGYPAKSAAPSIGQGAAQPGEVPPMMPPNAGGGGFKPQGVLGNIGQTALDFLKGPALETGIGWAANALFGPKEPEYPSPEEYWNFQNFQIPGLQFNNKGELIGVDPNKMPTQVILAQKQIDRMLQQQLELLRNEAARSGMLNSSQYVEEVQRLQAEGVQAKQQVYSQYISQAMGMMQNNMQMGAQYSMGQYQAEYNQYAQKQQALGGAVQNFYDWLAARREREWQEQQMNQQYPQG